MSKNGGTTEAELKRMGCRPHEPKMSHLPVWREFVRDPDCDTPQGEAWTNGRYDCVVVPNGDPLTLLAE